MIDTLIATLPETGPYGAFLLLIVIYVVDRLVTRNATRTLAENHLGHLQEGVDALVKAAEEQTELLRDIKEDLALQHQTIDYLWQNRQA